MPSTLEPTRWPGVYRRRGVRGDRFPYCWRDGGGRQRWATADTEDLARRQRARKIADRRQTDAVTLHDYALEWVDRYAGRTRTGIREGTRREYRRDLVNHVLPRMGRRLRVVEVTPRRVSDLLADLVRSGLADTTIRRVVAPLRACLHTAVAEGLIDTNPCASVKVPVRPQVVDDEDAHAKVLTDEQLSALLAEAGPEWLDLLMLLVLTGLRISEALGLRWRDVVLDGPVLEVQVRQRYRAGTFEPPKTRDARREVPMHPALADRMRARKAATKRPRPNGLVFVDELGEPLEASKILGPAMKRPARAVGVPWAGFHAMRHTCASRLIADGRNVVQVQRWLGHHSAEYTLRVYAHLQQTEGIGEAVGLPIAAQNDDGPAREGGAVVGWSVGS